MRILLTITMFIFVQATSSCYEKIFGEKINSGELARQQAEKCVKTQYNADAKGWIECIHPKVLESQGGREKMLKDLQEVYSMVGKIPYDSMKVELPKEVKELKNSQVAVVPYQITKKNFSGEKENSRDFLIGISEDDGKTWRFINSSSVSIDVMEKNLPGIKALEMPEIELE